MKILVPTDFSDCAYAAFITACTLASRYEAEIHLYHAASIPKEWFELAQSKNIEGDFQQSIVEQAKHKLELLKSESLAKGVHCFYHYDTGSFLDGMVEFASNTKFDLVVMGSHGASGKREWLIGSNTQKVLRKLHLEVLVVKQPVTNFDFQEAAFVTGLFEEEKQALRMFVKRAKKWRVDKIHILVIDTNSWFSQPTLVMKEALEDFKKVVHPMPCDIHFYKDYSIQAGIQHFAEEMNISLLAISYHTRHPIKRWFQGSQVEMLINHSSVPVLSIDYTS